MKQERSGDSSEKISHWALSRDLAARKGPFGAAKSREPEARMDCVD